MILKTLAFIVPHFTTRCLLRDEDENLIAVCRGGIRGDYLIVEKDFIDAAELSPYIDVALGISWFGWVIFFYIKQSFDRIEV